MPFFRNQVTEYSEKYSDGRYDFRHVVLTKAEFERLPRDYLEFYEPGKYEKRNMTP